MELLSKDSDVVKEYRKKLLGDSPIKDAPQLYWDTSLFLSLEGAVDYTTWTSLPIHEKAKLRAMIQLRNMADILDRHKKEQEEERKKVFGGKNKVDA